MSSLPHCVCRFDPETCAETECDAKLPRGGNLRPSADYQDGFNTANERADERIRELEAEVAQLDGRLTDAVLDKALMAKRIRELKAEVARLTERLINGPANMQECAEFCRVAREDGDGKPCLDCHPENFHF